MGNLPNSPIAPTPSRSFLTVARRLRVHPLYLLILLAVVLRLVISPDRPGLWTDEGMTFIRVCGTWPQMLDMLSRSGFAPLHYELYWLLGQWVRLTPPVMRLVPALCGVATVPAMYWLARQLADRRSALLVATLAACSAYLNNYSRDAKMYSELWLFGTLSAASFLWWLRLWQRESVAPRERVRRHLVRVAFLLWVASSVAMVGLHTPGMILLAIEPLFLLTARRVHWPQALLLTLGLAVILTGPAIYYARFSRLEAQTEDQTVEEASGTTWVKSYNLGRTGGDLLLYTASAYLLSWEWPRPADLHDISPAMLRSCEWLTVGLLGLAAVGAFPWPRRWRGDRDGLARRTGRRWLWLAIWLVVPAYGFYCNSIVGFQSPAMWARNLMAWLTSLGRDRAALVFGSAVLLGIVAVWLAARTWAHRLRWAGGLAITLVIVVGLCDAVWDAFPDQPDGSLWMPRYLGMLWPAFAIALCLLLMRLPTRGFRWMAIALLLGANLWRTLQRIEAATEPPLDRMAADVVQADTPRRELIGGRWLVWQPHSPQSRMTRTYTDQQSPGLAHPGYSTILTAAGRYYLAMADDRVFTPAQLRFPSRAGGGLGGGPGGGPGDGAMGGRRGRRPGGGAIGGGGGGGALRSAGYYVIPSSENPTKIVADVHASPQLSRVIVWDRLSPDNAGDPDEALGQQLGTAWRCVSIQRFPVRMQWIWQMLYISRRREYVRVP